MDVRQGFKEVEEMTIKHFDFRSDVLVFGDKIDDAEQVTGITFRVPPGHHIAYTRLGPDEPLTPIVVKDRAHGVLFNYEP